MKKDFVSFVSFLKFFWVLIAMLQNNIIFILSIVSLKSNFICEHSKKAIGFLCFSAGDVAISSCSLKANQKLKTVPFYLA